MTAVCQDGAATRLRCAECDAGICPACLVRTPIGYKCRGCTGGAVGGGRRRRTRLRVLAGTALLAPLAYAVLLASSGDGAGPGMPAASPVAVAGPTRQAMIGEEAHDGQLVFVVDDFSCDANPAGGKVCTLHFNVRNTSDSPARFLGRFQYLVDAQGRTYGASSEASGHSLSELTVNPGIVVPLAFVFDVPDAVEPAEAQFRGTGRGRLGVTVRLQRRTS